MTIPAATLHEYRARADLRVQAGQLEPAGRMNDALTILRLVDALEDAEKRAGEAERRYREHGQRIMRDTPQA